MSRKIVKITMTLGIVLILASVTAVTVHHFSQKNAAQQIQTIAAELISMMPETEYGTPGRTGDTEMPVHEIDNNDFIGLIEIPAYQKVLPVYSEWDKKKITKFPCRYMGSMYDGSLVVGTVEDPGQFDCAKEITGGIEVTFTDVTGLKYTYIITDAYKTEDVSTEKLTESGGELVLFVRSTYGSDYMIISCSSR